MAANTPFDPSRADYYAGSVGNVREVVFGDYLTTSQMSDAERCTTIMLLDKIRPECAIEVGTADGGSLSMIAKYAKKVYSLDIDPRCSERFAPHFDNVEFVVGDSAITLPNILSVIQASGEKLGFVLIDGLHTAAGVRTDIESLMKYRPVCPLYVLLHDSFNPDCRTGIAQADWAASPYVHYVELDFVGGQFNRREGRGAREMWCGFALALMRPEVRQGQLNINADEGPMYEAVLRQSAHRRRLKRTPRQVLVEMDQRYLDGFLKRRFGRRH
jgi:hypothetical protein